MKCQISWWSYTIQSSLEHSVLPPRAPQRGRETLDQIYTEFQKLKYSQKLEIPAHIIKKIKWETSLVVQWLRLYAPNAGGQGSIPGQGTRSHMVQLKIPWGGGGGRRGWDK